MSAIGTGEAAIFCRLGMARAKPISANMPRTPELTTDQITALGTVTRALTASSERSAANDAAVNCAPASETLTRSVVGVQPGTATPSATQRSRM